MTVLVVILAVLAVAALVAAVVAWSRLDAQRRLAAAAEERATRQAGELATTTDALLETARQRVAAEEQLEAAGVRALEAQAAVEAVRREVEEAVALRQAAEQRAAAAEQRADELAAGRAATADGGGIDPHVLWTLEQARSERTWRQSVAPAVDAASVFDDTSNPLLEALQVELDAAREDVGAIVELDADLPPGVTAAGSVLVLRAAQELLAGVVRRSEATTLEVRADGHDLLVAVRSVDEDGEPVATEPLAIPPSADIEAVQDGVRIRNAIRSDETGPDWPR